MDYDYFPESSSPIENDGNLETLSYVAQSMKMQVSREREKFRALESRTQKIRAEAYHRIRQYEARLAAMKKELEAAQSAAKSANESVKHTQRKAAEAIKAQTQRINTLQNATAQELRELKIRNEELARKLREASESRESAAREARDLREHTLRSLTQELSELKRRLEHSVSGAEIRDLVEKQIIPAYQRLHSEIVQSERRTHEVIKLRDQMHEFISRLSFLDSAPGDFNHLNQQVVRIEESLSAGERAMAQISCLLQAFGKQQEQANDLFLSHTENFLKKQMAGLRQMISECLAENQNEMREFVRGCFRDMADGFQLREAGTSSAHKIGSASAPILAGPPPGVLPASRPAATGTNKTEHLRSLLQKKNEEIRKTDEKLLQTDPESDAYQKLSLVKELLRTQREHISRLTDKLAPGVDDGCELRSLETET